MITHYRYFALVLGLFFLSGEAAAQQNLTLLECIDYALENNLEIEQARINERLSEVDVHQAKIDLFPDLNGSASHNVSFGRSVNPITDVIDDQRISAGNLGLNTSLLLFSGFRQLNAIAQAKYNMMANQSAVERIKQQVMVNVAATFVQVLYSREQMAATQEQVNISKSQVENAQRKVDVGTIPMGDLLQLKATLANDELTLTQAINTYEINLLDLKNFLNINPSTPFGIEVPANVDLLLEQIKTDYSLSEVFTRAVEINPAMQEAANRRLAAEENLQIARGGLLPSLSFGAGLGTRYSNGTDFTINDQLDQNFNQYFGFQLSIPIFNKFQAQNTIKRARLNLEGARITENTNRNELNQIIAQALADLRAAEKNYSSALRAFESSRLAFEYSQKRFDVGLTNAIDLNLSKTQLAQAEVDMLQSKYDLIFRSKVIDYYLGNSLAF
ncbi:outer membrane protein [Anseongella ginsenosidimutans]|uniref:Outer membrane protein n=1 Tax=Anseongella ginsenosidimutans TaxID=496056 RepID=A0A4R3KQ37_9SPHI|nr:TolC family protein [Anseongella ginsenosidimutans]QEC52650.1 TolC family protein [Anseongella ginsenosidimutans]TCS86574.1 outer membrane protein [Anseongella ginsenosidimutans]